MRNRWQILEVRLISGMGAAVGAWLLCSTIAFASGLPDQAALRQALKTPVQTIEVVEPHETTQHQKTRVKYLGWPVEVVLDHLFGADWRKAGLDVEFRALDGYVSRIPVERFDEYPAYLVFDSLDRSGFAIDNPMQNEKDVPLGPYYLVWDNIRHPDLLADGGTYWPYQVSEVLVSEARLESLLPGKMREQYAKEAAVAQKYCLSCHVINGYGGEKWPIDLVEHVKDMKAEDFKRWVLTPNTVKPGTTMPALPEQMSEYEREALAQRIFDYLSALPTQTP
jgi:mono/diheme cytochrome c family protein